MDNTSVEPRPHPAKYNSAILDVILEQLQIAEWNEHWDANDKVVDPFAGVGGIHDLAETYHTYGVELEPEWGEQMLTRGPGWIGDFFEWEPEFKVGAVVTSPTYANRMADNHTPGPDDHSKRITYRHALGRKLTEGNSGELAWGTAYRAFHIRAWIRVAHLLAGGGVFVVNVKDHVRAGEVVPVADWHRKRIITSGFEQVADVKVPVKGMGFGANGKSRVDHERVMVFVKHRDESRWNTEGLARLEAKRDAAVVRHGA